MLALLFVYLMIFVYLQ